MIQHATIAHHSTAIPRLLGNFMGRSIQIIDCHGMLHCSNVACDTAIVRFHDLATGGVNESAHILSANCSILEAMVSFSREETYSIHCPGTCTQNGVHITGSAIQSCGIVEIEIWPTPSPRPFFDSHLYIQSHAKGLIFTV